MRSTALTWCDDPPAVDLLDQTALPSRERRLVCTDVPQLVDAIRRLAVRGAPLLGIAGGYGVALAALRGDDVAVAADALAAARPTAVNLAWAVRRTQAAFDREGDPAAALAEAHAIRAEDEAAAERIAEHGLALVPDGARVLTHCNTGWLVSGGGGTALGIVAAAHRAGRLRTLWVDETRPLLQGARLTAYEAARAGMPHAVLADGAAGSLFSRGMVDLVVVGADRIAADGSVANKVGTYPLAVLARHHDVPFVVAAPVSTVDLDTDSGADIVIEQRAVEEVTSCGGAAVAPPGSDAYNPAFDVTPPALVTAIVTEAGVVAPVSRETLARVAARKRPQTGATGATMSG